MTITINRELKEYTETFILPLYSKNDKGHNINHIRYVLERCFRFAPQFTGINLDMLYAIACFHDIAHHIDKKNHETLSADFFRNDAFMKSFFSAKDFNTIAEAIEDHRASATSQPRSDYGKIISSADRSTDVDEFLRRTHAYTLKHQPLATSLEMINRAYLHTSEKYGKKGYAKHYVIDPEYDTFRKRISELIEDRLLFEKEYKKTNNI